MRNAKKTSSEERIKANLRAVLKKYRPRIQGVRLSDGMITLRVPAKLLYAAYIHEEHPGGAADVHDGVFLPIKTRWFNPGTKRKRPTALRAIKARYHCWGQPLQGLEPERLGIE